MTHAKYYLSSDILLGAEPVADVPYCFYKRVVWIVLYLTSKTSYVDIYSPCASEIVISPNLI